MRYPEPTTVSISAGSPSLRRSVIIVTRTVVDTAGSHLEFERIGEVRLKGFAEPTELFVAGIADEE